MAERYFNCLFPYTEGTVLNYDSELDDYFVHHPGVGWISYSVEYDYAKALDTYNASGKDPASLKGIVPDIYLTHITQGFIREISSEATVGLRQAMDYRYYNLTSLLIRLLSEMSNGTEEYPEYCGYVNSYEYRAALMYRYLVNEKHLEPSLFVDMIPKAFRDKSNLVNKRIEDLISDFDNMEIERAGCGAIAYYCEMRFAYDQMRKAHVNSADIKRKLAIIRGTLIEFEKTFYCFDAFFKIEKLAA